MNYLKVSKLNLSYGPNIVIKDLTFQLAKGDFLCIVGPNGCGKSTLIKSILGEIKPISGRITFAPKIKPNTIGYLPQNNSIPDNFPATAKEIVAIGTFNKSLNATERKSLIEKNLELLDIKNLENQSFSDLSGGQKQKTLLARALCATSEILILDEISNNLDYDSKIAFYTIIKELNQNQNITIIMITHDLDHNNLLGNKLLSLDKSNPFFGDTSEYIRRIHAK